MAGSSPVRNYSDPLDTPVMRQYQELKSAHKDSVLLFRMGDFYELFMDDAVEAAPLMDVTLTARQGGVPMAGVPYHSADTYIARLLQAGKKVAIAEQEEDPSNPKLMRRVVRRVLSAGTVVEESLLPSAVNNYLMSVVYSRNGMGVGIADVSTGDFFTHEYRWKKDRVLLESDPVPADGAAALRDIFSRYSPSEVLISSGQTEEFRSSIPDPSFKPVLCEEWKASPLEGTRRISERWGGVSLKGLGYSDESSPSLGAVSLILHYTEKSFPGQTIWLDRPVLRPTEGDFIFLDEQTCRNLDLTENRSEGGRNRTLFQVMDQTLTAAGKRFLKESILTPFRSAGLITERLDAVEELLRDDFRLSGELQNLLSSTSDMERIISRFSGGRGCPRDFRLIADSLTAWFRLKELLSDCPFTATAAGLNGMHGEADESLKKLSNYIEARITEQPPAVLHNGPFVKAGFHSLLDKARMASEEGERWILQFEEEEKKRTGLSTLKVKYNRVSGYFIEISRNQSAGAPADYQRKQTLVNCERYTCEKLSSLETEISESDSVIRSTEAEIFREMSTELMQYTVHLKELSRVLAAADLLHCFARLAFRKGWVRPVFGSSGILKIREGRHPVVEHFMPQGRSFIPNDLYLSREGRSFGILTGPNMAGKSTYIRQAAILQIMAQMGSYIPAKEAELAVCDGIFTRIGSADNLTRGESTFFVEMLETAGILSRCTENSLVIMDEVGRGTSTYDGLSIAWGIVEYLTDQPGKSPFVLFATHYHELTALAFREGIFNLTLEVQKTDGKIVFSHRIRDGAADESYGIHVARLAGLPDAVIEKAVRRLAELESGIVPGTQEAHQKTAKTRKPASSSENQPDLF